jgi:hypothetical protein
MATLEAIAKRRERALERIRVALNMNAVPTTKAPVFMKELREVLLLEAIADNIEAFIATYKRGEQDEEQTSEEDKT